MRRFLATVVLVSALAGPVADAGRPVWLGGARKPRLEQVNPRYVSPPLVQPGQPTPRVFMHQAHNLAAGVFRQSTALKSIAGLYQRQRGMKPRQVRREVERIGRDIEAKYGLRVQLVDDAFQYPGLDAADGANPGKWLDAQGVILLRASLPPERLVKELGHEYGAFMLARASGGRGKVPRVGETQFFATHLLDHIVQGQASPAPMRPLR